MAYQVIQQPNGKLALFSTATNGWIVYDLSPDEMVQWFVDQAAEDARRSAQRVVDLVVAGNPREAYFPFALTFEEANDLSGDHGGLRLPEANGENNNGDQNGASQ